MQSLATFVTTARERDLPFVVYRKPHEQNIQAWLQEDRRIHYVNTYKESGFLFAPFDTKEKTVLFPTQFIDCYSYDSGYVSSPVAVASTMENDLTKEAHVRLVQRGLNAIKKGEMEKVVLSRKHDTTLASPNPFATLQRLLSSYPSAFVYCWYHPRVGLWLGASPETLLTIKNRQLETMSLAGTQKYDNKINVVWGEKEKREQALVTEAIAQSINPLLENSLDITGPITVRAGNLLHLKTSLKATIDTNKTLLKSIVNALHPTPAICGLPKDRAQKFISNNEGYNREFYTGFLGELNLKTTTVRSRSSRNIENYAYKTVRNSTSLFVNLRCMQWKENIASIYVGGGITSDSIPMNEWQETLHKLSTMRSIL